MRIRRFSVQVEVYFHGDFDSHRMTVFHRRLKLPVLHRFDRPFIQAHAEAAQYSNVTGAPVGAHDQAEGADTLILRLASFFGKLWLWVIDWSRRADTATDVENTSAGTATFTRTKARSFARANSAAAA